MVGFQQDLIAKKYTHIGKPQVLAAQRRKCFYCGRFVAARRMTRDHLRPRAAGFKVLTLNMVMCCQKCNVKKAHRMPTERELAKARVLYISLGAPGFAI